MQSWIKSRLINHRQLAALNGLVHNAISTPLTLGNSLDRVLSLLARATIYYYHCMLLRSARLDSAWLSISFVRYARGEAVFDGQRGSSTALPSDALSTAKSSAEIEREKKQSTNAEGQTRFVSSSSSFCPFVPFHLFDIPFPALGKEEAALPHRHRSELRGAEAQRLLSLLFSLTVTLRRQSYDTMLARAGCILHLDGSTTDCLIFSPTPNSIIALNRIPFSFTFSF